MSAVIYVNDKMQTDYSYVLEASEGQQFDDGFTPTYSPIEMLELRTKMNGH